MFGLLKKANRKVCGPSFKESHERVLDFSGNKLIMTLPGPEGPMPTDWAGERYRTSYNIFDEALYFTQDVDRQKREAEGRFPGFCAYEDGFAFFIQSVVKRLHFSVTFNLIINRCDHHGNLFNAENFELAILDLMQKSCGPESSLGAYGRRFITPVDWSLISVNENHWVKLGVEQIPHGSNHSIHLFSALSENHIVNMHFNRISYYNHGVAEEDAVNHFILQLIDYVRIERTSSVQAAKTREELSAPPSSMSSSREPFKWLEYDEYPENFFSDQQKRIVRLEAEMIEDNLASGRPKYTGLERPCSLERLEEQRKRARKIREELERQGKPIT